MKLKDYLDNNNITVASFARRCDCQSISIWNIIRKGSRPRPKLAKKIEEVTNGAITAEELRANKPLEGAFYEKYLPLKAIAEYGHVKTGSITTAIKHKKLKGHYRNGRWYVSKEDYDQYRLNRHSKLHAKHDGKKIFDMRKGHLSVEHVAKACCIALGNDFSNRRILYYIKTGHLRAEKKGTVWVIDRNDAEKFIKKMCAQSFE